MRFTMVIWMVEIIQVEARGIVEGLKLSWRRSYKQDEINHNNALLINIIRNGFASISNARKVRQIRE